MYFISLPKAKFHNLLTHFHFYAVIWHHDVSYALATTTTSLIETLFHKCIVYIMGNLRANLGCHISNKNRDKQGGGGNFKTPRSDRVDVAVEMNSHFIKLHRGLLINK